MFTVANLSACYSRVNGVFNLEFSVVWSQGAAVLLQNTILLEAEDLNSTIHTSIVEVLCRYKLHTHTEYLYVKHTLWFFSLKEAGNYDMFLHFLVLWKPLLKYSLLSSSHQERKTHACIQKEQVLFFISSLDFWQYPQCLQFMTPRKKLLVLENAFFVYLFSQQRAAHPPMLPPKRCLDHAITSPLFSLNLKMEGFQWSDFLARP